MLRLTLPYIETSGVRRLQELLGLVSDDFRHLEADGVFGPATDKAVRAFQSRVGLKVDGIYGPNTAKALRKFVDRKTSVGAVREIRPLSLHLPMIVDISAQHAPPRNARKKPRSLLDVDAIVLHQTGCEMPSNPLGWSRVNAHYGITLEGAPVRLNPIDMMIWHAQRLSYRSIGIEVEGNHPGLKDEMWTLWEPGGGPHEINQKMVLAAQSILQDILTLTAVRHVFAHRQSSKNRRACPGEAIWKNIGMPMRDALQCDPKDLCLRFGDKAREIPLDWDPLALEGY